MTKKNYCRCGGEKYGTVRRVRKLYPCYWLDQKHGSPVGEGELGNIHPLCLLGLGLYGLLSPPDQQKFEEGLGAILTTRSERLPLVGSLMILIPPLDATPWKDSPFTPTNYAPNGNVPARYADNIMRLILEASQQIDSTMTAVDPADFEGTYYALWVSIYKTERYTFIDELRGITEEERIILRDTHNSEPHGVPPKNNERKLKQARHTGKGKRRRISAEIAELDADAFQVTDAAFDKALVLNSDPNKLKEGEQNRFRNQMGIDENWTTREGVYERDIVLTVERQVRSGLISAESILKDGNFYALHFTLTNPLGAEWKKVNGELGVILSAKMLQERAGMFPNQELDPLDIYVWFTMAFQNGINRVRIRNFGENASIPDGTVIYMGVVYPDSVYYAQLAAYGITPRNARNHGRSYLLPTNHAMSAIYRQGGVVVPDAWVQFEYYRGVKADSVSSLEYTPPNLSGKMSIT